QLRALRLPADRDAVGRAARGAHVQGRRGEGDLRPHAPRRGRRRRGGDQGRAALRPHGAARALRRDARARARLSVPSLPDPARVARRDAAGAQGPVPRVLPVRHRHHQPREALLPRRSRDPERHLQRVPRDGDRRVPHPHQQPQGAERVAAGLSRAAAGELRDLISKGLSTDETLSVLTEFKNCAQGLAELREIVQAIRQFGVPDSAFAVDLGVVRGLDYYTGTIYETALVDYPELGSICSGGRYDDLASYFTETRLPGVGISIGLTRLFSKLKEAGLLQPLERTPAEVLVTTMDRQYLERYLKLAAALRAAGVNTEVYLEPAKLGSQLTYADRKGFRLALIAGETEFAKNVVQIKNLATKTARDVPLEDVVPAVRETLS